jgi:hypothetical protein
MKDAFSNKSHLGASGGAEIAKNVDLGITTVPMKTVQNTLSRARYELSASDYSMFMTRSDFEAVRQVSRQY